jgi:transposase InsO family protein
MPWRETSPMEQRLEFVREYATELFTMTELAAQYGISRKTGYKWVERYETDGADGLRDRSRRPHESPQATDAELIEALLMQRRRHPRWGATKLLAIATRQAPEAVWPSRSTVCTHLKANGFVRAARRRSPAPEGRRTSLQPIIAANDVWTTDFKGEFRTGDGMYCYPLTLRDGFSRYVLRCDGLLSRTLAATQQRFARAFTEYGLPTRIRSDNGLPFASPGVGGLSTLSVWWIRLGIVPERIAPGHPEQNGSHEQFHRVLKAETARPPAPNGLAQQQRFRRFIREYNEVRPHEALGNESPASRYAPSPRRLPRRLPPLEYPGHMEPRRVSSCGTVSWAGMPLFVATALAGEYIAFEEVDDGLWTLWFATVALARYDERHRSIHPITPQMTAGRSASFAGSAPDLEHGKHDG